MNQSQRPNPEGAAQTQCQKPCVHRFASTRNRYVLDVNTNRTLQLDPVTWDIIEHAGVLTKPEIIRQFSDKHAPAEISRAYDGIAAAQQSHGVLLPRCLGPAGAPSLERMQAAIGNMRIKVTLCATEDCNFRCTYCAFGDGYRIFRKHSKNTMEWDVARRAIDDFIRHSHDAPEGEKCIAFYGGEPLLNIKLLEQCIRYARNALGDRVAFEVSTNGSLLHGDAAQLLASENVCIFVSLNGPAHIHDYHRLSEEGHATWSTVTENIRAFVDRYPQYAHHNAHIPFLHVETVLAPLMNALDVNDFFSCRATEVLHYDPTVLISEVSADDSIMLDALAPEDRSVPGMETLYRQFLSNLVNGEINRNPGGRAWRFQRWLFEQPFQQFLQRTVASSGMPHLPGASRLDTMCTPGWANCFVSADGKYYPCTRLPTCATFEIGDVWTGIDVGRCHELKKRYVELCEDECSECWCVNFCHADCCSEAREGDRITHASKHRVCERYRSHMDRMLTDLFDVLEVNPHAFDYHRSRLDRKTDRSNAH